MEHPRPVRVPFSVCRGSTDSKTHVIRQGSNHMILPKCFDSRLCNANLPPDNDQIYITRAIYYEHVEISAAVIYSFFLLTSRLHVMRRMNICLYNPSPTL